MARGSGKRIGRDSLAWFRRGEEGQPCFLCLAPGTGERKCSWCQNIVYCSQEHYARHRVNSKCYPFLRDGEDLVSARALSPGELVFTEEPLLTSPNLHSPPTCPSCLKRLLSDSKSRACPQGCPLRLCRSNQCMSKEAHGPECRVLRENKVRVDYGDYGSSPMPINSVVAVLRLLDFKEKWGPFFGSVPIEERRKAKGEWEVFQRDVVDFIRRRLFMASKYGEEELHYLLGLFVHHSVPLSTNGGRGLFPIFSLVTYDCIGNCRFRVDPKSKRLSLLSRQALEKGDRLTVNSSPSVLGTLKRRKRLKSLYHMDCTCRRCSDPTECETYVSALMCEACPRGIMLPNRPLEPGSEWSCSDCDFLLTGIVAEGIIDRTEEELTDISMRKNREKLEDFISHYEDKVLHRDHYLLLLAKRNYVLISRKDKIASLATSNGPHSSESHPLSKEELFEDFWWIITRLGLEDCF